MIKGPTILTFDGHYFSFADPNPAHFTLRSIAQGLANTCRFGGQCRPFYSVAEHSVWVSRLVPEEFALAALFHDAHEAERKRRQDHAIDVFKRKVLKRFPGVQFNDNGWSKPRAHATKENGRWRVTQVSVSFEFPGMKHGPANYRWDAPSTYRKAEKAHFTCCNGDREAFESWASMVRPA